jgi:NADH dehydrogenase (ubiquinone) 1 alpha subcomplex subunit 9
MPFSPRDENSIKQALQNSDVVINLIGKDYEPRHIVPTRQPDGSISRINYTFSETHVEIPRTIARLAKEAGVKSFIHMSAMAADVNSPSSFFRTKALGEIAVREQFPEAVGH